MRIRIRLTESENPLRWGKEEKVLTGHHTRTIEWFVDTSQLIPMPVHEAIEFLEKYARMKGKTNPFRSWILGGRGEANIKEAKAFRVYGKVYDTSKGGWTKERPEFLLPVSLIGDFELSRYTLSRADWDWLINKREVRKCCLDVSFISFLDAELVLQYGPDASWDMKDLGWKIRADRILCGPLSDKDSPGAEICIVPVEFSLLLPEGWTYEDVMRR